jgi:hypothetical protein
VLWAISVIDPCPELKAEYPSTLQKYSVQSPSEIIQLSQFRTMIKELKEVMGL